MEKDANNDGRRKQVAVGAMIMLVVFGSTISLLNFWRYIPGWLGESIGMFAGMISSPFMLEGFFLIMGFFLIIFLNSWRRKSGGDEFVEFDASEFESGRKRQPEDPE